tara:strand:+ start:471 stop:881 length:411 start_codon:yes stop_codon:yes gene_type:complete
MQRFGFGFAIAHATLIYNPHPFYFSKNFYTLAKNQTMARAVKRDPKVGTGKKPKGSGRRLYTDENPKDTVSIKFATPADARATVAKVKRISKPYARKIQILTVGEQRAKVMGKNEVASIFKRGKESIRRSSGKSNV